MNILCALNHTPVAPWVAALRQALPQAQVTPWVPGAPQADYAVVRSPTQPFFDEQPRLRGIFNVGAGVDALAGLNLPPGVPLIRLDDAGMAVQMAEYVCHMVIRHYRQFDKIESHMARGQWQAWPLRPRSEFPIGIMGLGVLGQRVIQALSAFEFPLRGWSRSPKQIPGVACFSGDAQLSEFLTGSRILINLLPLTPATRGILCAAHLRQLLPHAYLINVARGAHVVDDDLLTLLNSGHLAGAALDVFDPEPLPPAHPFWTHPAITLTPHLSAHIDQTAAVAQIAHKLMCLQRGDLITGVVNTARGY